MRKLIEVVERPWAEIKAIKVPKPRWFHISVYFTDREKTDPDTGVVTKYLERSAPRTYKKPKKGVEAVPVNLEQGVAL